MTTISQVRGFEVLDSLLLIEQALGDAVPCPGRAAFLVQR
jgi:hypothetical protein